jgi:hypothetical protein
MRLVMGLAVLGCVLVSSGIARAAPPTEQAPPSKWGGPPPSKWGGPPPSKAPEEPEYDDYRLSLLGSDLTAISLVVVGALVYDDNDAIGNFALLGGFATYALGGPIIHLVHEQPGRALGSLALRVGLPGAGVLIIAGLASSCQSGGDGGCEAGAVLVGGTLFLGGFVTAMIVDDGFLGKVPKSRAKNETRDASSFQAGLAPLIDPKKKSVGLSLVGAF